MLLVLKITSSLPALSFTGVSHILPGIYRVPLVVWCLKSSLLYNSLSYLLFTALGITTDILEPLQLQPRQCLFSISLDFSKKKKNLFSYNLQFLSQYWSIVNGRRLRNQGHTILLIFPPQSSISHLFSITDI